MSVTFTGTPWRSHETTTHATTAGSTSLARGTVLGEVTEVRSVEWVTNATLMIGTT